MDIFDQLDYICLHVSYAFFRTQHKIQRTNPGHRFRFCSQKRMHRGQERTSVILVADICCSAIAFLFSSEQSCSKLSKLTMIKTSCLAPSLPYSLYLLRYAAVCTSLNGRLHCLYTAAPLCRPVPIGIFTGT